jgi:hypothetical protein
LANYERRTRIRFPLETDLRFHIIRRGQGKPIQGTGQVVNMSSKGLAFRTDTPLECGQRLSISMAWPALLDDKCLLRLVLDGTIIRADGDFVVISIETHDFRTSGRSTAAVREEVATISRDMETLFPIRA